MVLFMGKRNTIVVLSSDDEEHDRPLSSNRTSSKSKSKSAGSRTYPRAAKKPRLPSSRPRLCKDSSIVDEIRLSFQDFDEAFNGFKVSTGFTRSDTKELWVDKYKPCSLEELAVHRKKVEEVKIWFEERLKSSKDRYTNHVIVLTGQAGVGKSATIHVIASHLGSRLCEWTTPTPTIWQEHVHNTSTGINYRSKLDEFESFVERIRKYGLIPSCLPGESRSSVILVIDDLPVINGRSAFERLQKCLLLLVRSTRMPTAILVTDFGKADSADNSTRYSDQLQLSLESAGACKVAFNPITNNSIKKTLLKVCRLEKRDVTTEQLDLIAKASGGDIRHAITSLQLFCLKPHPRLNSSSTPSNSEDKAAELNELDDGFSLLYGRDETLSLFHALGKFLHNKREAEKSMAFDQAELLVQNKFLRLPLKMDAPERILRQAHVQARPIADFLHENVLDFLSEEAMDDAWTVASYLGDADLLLASFRGALARNNDAESILQSAAASIAARGVLFGNSHPSPSRWHAIRRPKLWQVEQSSLRNKNEMVNQRFYKHYQLSSSDVSVIATDYTPVLKWLGCRASGDLAACHVSAQGNEMEDDYSERMSLDDQENEILDVDEIEEW